MPSIPIDTSTDGYQIWPQVGAPAVTARQFVRVIGLDLTASAAAVVSLKSGNSTVVWSTEATAGDGVGGIVLPVDHNRTIDCLGGETLNLGISAGVTVRGSVEVVVFGPPPGN